MENLDIFTKYISSNWQEFLVFYIIGQIVTVKLLIKSVLSVIRKLPSPVKKPLLSFLDMVGSELEEQIKDEEVLKK